MHCLVFMLSGSMVLVSDRGGEATEVCDRPGSSSRRLLCLFLSMPTYYSPQEGRIFQTFLKKFELRPEAQNGRLNGPWTGNGSGAEGRRSGTQGQSTGR